VYPTGPPSARIKSNMSDVSRHRPLNKEEPVPIFKNQFVSLYSVKANFEDHTKDYFVVERGPVAAVLVHRNDEILLVRQYRFVIDDLSWEIPAGGIDTGESPETAAIRECSEESGIDCGRITPLINYPLGVDATAGEVNVFHSATFEDNGLPLNKETVERRWFSTDDVVEMIFSGKLKHAITIIAVLAFLQKRHQGMIDPS
jgi:ADP-ribose pyrophosphatase